MFPLYKLRAAAHVAKKRRSAVSNCCAVIINVIRVMYIDENQAAGLFWTFVWRVVTRCRSSDIRQVSHETDFVVVLGDICEKNSGAQS